MDFKHLEQASEDKEQIQIFKRENVSFRSKTPDVSVRRAKIKKTFWVWFQLQLRERNERLLAQVNYLERRVEHLSASGSELSSRLIGSEEDKLKVQVKDCP